MLAGLLLLAAALIYSLQFKPVQTYVAKKAARYLSDELHTRVEVKSLYIKPFKSLVLEGFYVQDLDHDTLLFSPRFTVDLNTLSIKKRKISVNTVRMDNGKFYLKQYKDTSTNLEFIINYFDTGTTKPKKKPRKPYDITFDHIVLNNIAFKYKNFNFTKPVKGINFEDVDLRHFSMKVNNLDTKKHLVQAGIQNLTFREKSGFYLKNLTAQTTIDTNQMEFRKLLLETPHSRISDYFLMKYTSFRDFNHFVKKVYMKAHFNNARVYSRDVSFFASELNKMNIDIRANGNVSGHVNNLKAKNLEIKAGKTSYLKGDFSVKGLPKLSETMLDLKFDQIYSNKQDMDLIVTKVTGRNGSVLPTELKKFGNIHFKGRFTGFTNDFIAFGEFKTALGRVESDINMKIGAKGTPVYSGVIKTYDFNVGDLLNEKSLGRTTLTANVKGRSFSIKNLNEEIKSDIKYLDFNGYRYTNVKVDGSYIQDLFNGRVTVNDRNLKLNFNGGINLKAKLPVFDFTASIKGANLKALRLTKDTIRLDADFNTNFNGKNLDNIQGNLDIRKIRISDPRQSFVVDSLSLTASGVGNQRQLNINSDILDASIKGQYDLKTFPSYFKAVAKSYIPSLQVKYVKPGAQNFTFNMHLKYFEPISLLFIPELKIPDEANLFGQFNSAEHIANLNGFIKTAYYNKVKINNLIIDQTTTPKALNLFITSDQIDLSDSLYIKNVNIANILKNDSLSLNIKLSDKNATNQLDLNGLVEFSQHKDSTARLSILPSDVIINREIWRIQEKVNFRLENDRVIVKNFELFRNDQFLTVNGAISKNPKDELLIGFNHFKLTTFNPLTKPLGISLRGELNGNAKVAALGKTPNIEAELKIDTLHYNNIPIGDLTLEAGLDNSTRLINVKMDIVNQGVKSLDVSGTYNANVERNNLDMDVRLNDNEVILFQPFLNKLVSNLTGKVSADLKVQGELVNPSINGTLSLNKVGMTVNYLKTPYHISDKVSVHNSVIKLTDLIIKDQREHEAIANGTVDMSNPDNPDIRVTLVANNFMALNTTARDNPLYYGTAYGSGVFKFYGPTDNMRIDIDAYTQPGTVFNIPLNSSETVSENDFITFVTQDSTALPKKKASFNGLVMKFDLHVDENTEVNIYTDLGKLSGRGNTDFDMRINSLGDFEMYGTYQISRGKFEFTAQDFINKIFEIREGGSIRWTGNPTEATINLNAIYGVRTSIKPLYIAAGRTQTEGDQRVLAEAVMTLTGSLLRPTINFDINFPADASVKDEFQNYLSDKNNVDQQAISLIVRRSFAPGTGTDLLALNSTVINATTELFFNQLNSVLTQTLNLNYVDFNIRSLNEASASFRLLNGRLILTGGVTDKRGDLKDYSVIGGSSVARDMEASYLLNKEGNLILRASNKLNNRNFLNSINSGTSNATYVSALGLVYRQEFDNLGEFLRKLIGKNRREERQSQEAKRPKATALSPEESNKKSKK